MVQFIKNRFKGSEMTHKNEEETVVDAQMHHPFRCLVAGPSQSGKSTFVRNLLLWQNDIIMHHVLDHHRYIVIMGDLKTSPKLKYRTDIFATHPIPHQTIYHLENSS